MSHVQTLPLQDIAAICRKWQISELSVFGSILRDDFGPDSDVDFLYEFAPDAKPTLFSLYDIEQEFIHLVHRPVDLVSKNAVQCSKNPYRKKQILDNAKVIYG